MKPVITECNFNLETHGICFFKLTIVNQKPHNVTLKKMMMKKKSLLSKYIPVYWFPPTIKKEARSSSLYDTLAARLSSKTITFIKDQETLEITAKINLDPKATYRLLVKTSAGNCQYDLTDLDLFAIANKSILSHLLFPKSYPSLF